MKRAVALPAALLAGALVLAACGDDAASSHNEADVEFATNMIPHHGQAIEMADLALEKADNSEVKDLATDIKDAQDPEIEQMSEWLESWDEPVPDASMEPGGHGGMDMEGMMSDEDMQMLEQSSGADFDRTWTEMMIEHHEGAVAAAETELADGDNDDVKELAQAVVDGQSKEIDTMKELLGSLGG